MKKLITVVAIALVFVGTVSFAQQPPPQSPGGGHQMPMQGGMCPMMGGMMGMGGGMPMMGMMLGSPGESAKLTQMRGEMMKAVGDVLIKYGKMMETAR